MEIGIVGTGYIARIFASESKYVSGVELSCAYNPNINSAAQFASEFDIPIATDDWDRLLSNCDALYLATPKNTHVDYVKRALNANRHVLCEKPLTYSRQEAEGLFILAKQHEVILMEALKTAYTPGYKKIIELCAGGAIGKVVAVDAAFTKLLSNDSRELKPIPGNGSWSELSCYVCLPIFGICGSDFGEVEFFSLKDVEGIDYFTRANFVFDDFVASATTGLQAKGDSALTVLGTEGYIRVPAPWWKAGRIEVRGEDPNYCDLYEIEHEGAGLRYEIAEFVRRCEKGLSDAQAEAISCAVADVIDKYYQLN